MLNIARICLDICASMMTSSGLLWLTLKLTLSFNLDRKCLVSISLWYSTETNLFFPDWNIYILNFYFFILCKLTNLLIGKWSIVVKSRLIVERKIGIKTITYNQSRHWHFTLSITQISMHAKLVKTISWELAIKPQRSPWFRYELTQKNDLRTFIVLLFKISSWFLRKHKAISSA